jgi:hypothetical protein
MARLGNIFDLAGRSRPPKRRNRLVAFLLQFPELFIAAAMFAVTAALAVHFETSFVIPDGRISYYLGFRYAVPVAFATVWFSLPFLAYWLSGGTDPLTDMWLELGHNVIYLGTFVVVMWLHFHVKMWVPLINPARFDETYQRIDAAVQPLIDIFIAVRVFIADHSIAVDLWYLWAFVAMFFAAFAYHCVVDRRFFRPVLIATLINQCLGALSYLVAPAVGPFIYTRGENALATRQQDGMWAAYNQLTTNGLPWLTEHGVSYFNAGLAAMPSLHAGAAWVFLWYAYRSRSVLLPVYIILFTWIAVEAVVSKWHYLIDLPAGIALAAVSIWLANKVCAAAPLRQVSRPEA